MKTNSKIIVILALSIIIHWVSAILESPYLSKFLTDKIVEILITLLAINVATCGIVVSKLEEMSNLYNLDFTPTIKQVKLSVVYQIRLVISSIFCLILFHSKFVQSIPFFNKYEIFEVFLIAIFICALDILRDTGLAIFIITNKKKNV